MAAGTTTLFAARSPGAAEGGGTILVARTLGLWAVRPPSAFEVAGDTVVAETTVLLGAGPFGGVAGGGGGIMAVGNVGPTGGGGITLLDSMTGLSGARPAGGIDDVRPFRRRFGISAGFSTAGATSKSASGFGLGAVSLRRRFGRGPPPEELSLSPGFVPGSSPLSATIGWSLVLPAGGRREEAVGSIAPRRSRPQFG